LGEIPLIPKRIITIWLSEEKTPELIFKCVQSHNVRGYEHLFITLDNCYRGSKYVRDCLEAKDWVKAADYLRLYYLCTRGGIYVDADVDIKSNFDLHLGNQMITFKEDSGYLWNGCVGSVPNHPFLTAALRIIDNNFDSKAETFNAGMQFFTDLYYISDRLGLGMNILPMDEFKAIAVHKELKSWKAVQVSIIVPQLGRPEGLKRLQDSIKALNFPQYLIETILVGGDETVPTKVAKGLLQAKGEYIVYAANDMEFYPDSLSLAMEDSKKQKKGLVAFDSGVRNEHGYICEHFMIKRDLIEEIGGQIFDTDFHHVGVDDLLWAKCAKRNQAMISRGKIKHHHFSRIGSGIQQDDIIKKGWLREKEDRALLKEKLKYI
jgi:hypothetical protein